MAKTTVQLDDELLRAAKRRAIDEGTTLGRLIERGLRIVTTDAIVEDLPPLELPIVTGRGGALVDFASRASIYDAFDGA